MICEVVRSAYLFSYNMVSYCYLVVWYFQVKTALHSRCSIICLNEVEMSSFCLCLIICHVRLLLIRNYSLFYQNAGNLFLLDHMFLMPTRNMFFQKKNLLPVLAAIVVHHIAFDMEFDLFLGFQTYKDCFHLEGHDRFFTTCFWLFYSTWSHIVLAS